METGYQRGKIQDESMVYEQREHDGTLPIVGVNTFLAPDGSDDEGRGPIELARGTESEELRGRRGLPTHGLTLAMIGQPCRDQARCHTNARGGPRASRRYRA